MIQYPISLFTNHFSITRDDYMTRIDFMEKRTEDQGGTPTENVLPLATVILSNGHIEGLIKALEAIKVKHQAMQGTKQ